MFTSSMTSAAAAAKNPSRIEHRHRGVNRNAYELGTKARARELACDICMCILECLHNILNSMYIEGDDESGKEFRHVYLAMLI